jgi:hypothetical protein
MRFSLFKYATGILYGWTTVFDTVSPVRGPSPGGNAFIITGSGLDPRSWDDLFMAPVLDPKWVNISSGSGSVTTGAFHLQMETGATPGSVGGIESVYAWGDTQGEIRLILPPLLGYPTYPAVVVVSALTLYVDANNYSEMRLELDSAGVLQLRCDVYVGGSLVDELVKPFSWTTGLVMLKILRWGSEVLFIANGEVIFDSVRFVNAAAKFRIWMSNPGAVYNLQGVRVEWFYFRPFAVWQDQPVHDTVVVSDTRMRGLVPPSRDERRKDAAYQGLVNVYVVGASGTLGKKAAYEYYYIDGLKLLNSAQTDITMSVIDDAQLVTPPNEQKGLGGGY